MALSAPDLTKVNTELAKSTRGARAIAQGGIIQLANSIRVDTKDGITYEADFVDPSDLHVRTGDDIAPVMGALCAKVRA
jgi:hypothetical protein